MNILVTGGAGFVGTNLIKLLLNDRHKVTSIDNYNTGLKTNHQKGATYIEFDIRKISDYSAFGEFDIIFHMAAIARIQPSFQIPEEYFTVNANATLKLAIYCTENNIPLIYAGSSSHHSGKFKNPYTFSKDIGEEIIVLFQRLYGLKSSIARFYNVYGPHQLVDGGYTTLIGAWDKMIREGRPLIIYGDGEKRRDFTHVNDIVDGLKLIMEKQAWGHEFEFGRGKNYSVNEISKMFNKEVEYLEDKPGEAQNTLCESTLANEILGWEPKHNIEDYIKNEYR